MSDIKEVSGIVRRILNSKDTSIKKLVKKTGIPEREFFEFADLRGADFRRQDITGMSFFGSKVEGAIIDEYTKIDDDQAEFFRENGGIFTRKSEVIIDGDSPFVVPLVFVDSRLKIIESIVDDLLNYRWVLLFGERGSGKTAILEEVERILRDAISMSKSSKSPPNTYNFIHRIPNVVFGKDDLTELLMNDGDFRNYVANNISYNDNVTRRNNQHHVRVHSMETNRPKIMLLYDDLNKNVTVGNGLSRNVLGLSVSLFATSSEHEMVTRFTDQKRDKLPRSVYRLPALSKNEFSLIVLNVTAVNKPKLRMNRRAVEFLYLVTSGNPNLLVATLHRLLNLTRSRYKVDQKSYNVGIKETIDAVSDLANSGVLFADDLFSNSFLSSEIEYDADDTDEIANLLLNSKTPLINSEDITRRMFDVGNLILNTKHEYSKEISSLFDINAKVTRSDLRYLIISKIISNSKIARRP